MISLGQKKIQPHRLFFFNLSRNRKNKHLILVSLFLAGVRWIRLRFFSFFNVYFERESMSRGGAEREEDRGPEAGSVLTAVRLVRGSNSQNMKS